MPGITNLFYRLIPANPILLRVVENGGKRRDLSELRRMKLEIRHSDFGFGHSFGDSGFVIISSFGHSSFALSSGPAC